ncbi:nuclear transport factor 2 family protein [Nocardia fluminea]|uniref:nuclear transport factor 2 family protein n=1 Tax=Nocardia fluminea TaxID=134984 RepID=UPI003449F2DE
MNMDRFVVTHEAGGEQTEVTRKVVTDFFRALVDGDYELFERVASPDMRQWVAGDFWWSGFHTLEEAKAVRDAWFSGLKDDGADFKFELLSVLADGNRASVENRITATWKDGQPYESLCHIGLDVADGKVIGYREYFDTAYEARFHQSEKPY